jgi:hypothetical protein
MYFSSFYSGPVLFRVAWLFAYRTNGEDGRITAGDSHRKAVGKQAIRDGLASVDEAGFEKELAANIWAPIYQPYEHTD